MKKRVLAVVMVMLMAVSILPVSFAAEMSQPVGMNVSQMNTEDTQGHPVTGEIFSKYQLTVLNFWATWCGPCKSEMPHLQKFYEEHLSDGVNMLGVLMEDGNSTVAGGNTIIAEMGLTYTNLRVDSVLSKLYTQTFQGTSGASIPDSYVVDNTGKVLACMNGSFATYEQLEEWVMKFWNDPTPESVTLPEKAEVGVNRMTSLSMTMVPSYAMTDTVEWASSDENIVTVTESGLVTGVAEGKATVTVTITYGETTLSASCEVTVKESKELEEGTVYYKKVDEVKDGMSYAVVVNYGGSYYMMTSDPTVDGRYRLRGTEVDAKNMMLLANEDEELEIAFVNMKDENLWRFLSNSEGYAVANAASGEYLSTIRANGVYRLTLKNKDDVAWAFENGTIKAVTKGSYTGSRQFLSYFAEPENKYAEAFDLIAKDDALFTEVMYFEQTVVGNPDNPDERIPGDVNNNRMVDAGDATMVLRHIVGVGTPLTEEQIKIGDMNESGALDAGDATMILRITVG